LPPGEWRAKGLGPRPRNRQGTGLGSRRHRRRGQRRRKRHMPHRPASQDRLALLRGLAVALALGVLSAGCAAMAEWFATTQEASPPAPPPVSIVDQADDLARRANPP